METVLSTAGHRIATVDLGGAPGNVQYDAGTGHVLADVQTRDDITIIDATHEPHRPARTASRL